MAYNPYNALKAWTKAKNDWSSASNSGNSEEADKIAENAKKYTNELMSNGYEDVAKQMQNSDAERAKNILNLYSSSNKTAIRPYLKQKGKEYGISDEQMDKMITYNDSTGEVSLNGKSLGRPDALVDGVSYWDSDVLDKAWEDAVKANNYQTTAQTKLNDLWNMQMSDHDTINQSYANLESLASGSPFETDVGKAIMSKYNLDAINGKNDALASGASTNSGNIDSYAMANAQRQQAALTAQGQQAAINAQTAQVDNVRGVLSDRGSYNSGLYSDALNNASTQMSNEQRLFENDETAKNNQTQRWATQAEITGYVPDELTNSQNPYFNSDGSLKAVDNIDYMEIMNNASAIMNDPNKSESEKSAAAQTYNYATAARNKKILDNMDKYGQYYSSMVMPTQQQTAAVLQADADRDLQRYNIQTNADTQKYGYDTDLAMNQNNNETQKYGYDIDKILGLDSNNVSREQIASTERQANNQLDFQKMLEEKYGLDYLNGTSSSSTGKTTSSSTGTSTSKVSTEESKNNANDKALNWLYSIEDTSGNGTYRNYTEQNKTEYIAAEKISDSNVVTEIKSLLVEAGYSTKEAESKIDDYKKDIAISIAKAENKDYNNEDVINKIYKKYGW